MCYSSVFFLNGKLMQKISLIIILLIVFVNYLGFGLVYPLFAPMLFEPDQTLIDPDASQAYRGAILGILIALTPLAQFFSAPVFGALSDIKGRKPVLLVGISIGCLGYVLAVFGIWMNSLALLFIYRILVGVSDATAAVAQASLADISTKTNKARRFALYTFSLGLGFTIGPFIGGKLADSNLVSWFNYTTPFIAGGIMCLINLLLVYVKFPESQKIEAKKPFKPFEKLAQMGNVFLLKDKRWLFTAGFILSFGWAIYNQFIPVLLIDRFAFTQNDISNFYAYSSAWYAFSTGLGTIPLLKRFSPDKLIPPALLGASGCLLLMLAITNINYIWGLLPVLLYLLALVFPSAVTLVSNSTNSDRQGEVLGTYQSIQASAMGLSPLLVGSLVGVYPFMAALASGGLLILACLVFRVACRRFVPAKEAVDS